MLGTPLKSQIPPAKRFWKSFQNWCFFEKVANLKVYNFWRKKICWTIFSWKTFQSGYRPQNKTKKYVVKIFLEITFIFNLFNFEVCNFFKKSTILVPFSKTFCRRYLRFKPGRELRPLPRPYKNCDYISQKSLLNPSPLQNTKESFMFPPPLYGLRGHCLTLPIPRRTGY